MDERRLLVAYASNSGSTEEIAQAIGEELRQFTALVDVRRIDAQLNPAGYDAVIVGAPMILGWHRAARRFLGTNREALKGVPAALFLVAMSLTTARAEPESVPLAIDPDLAKPPRAAGRLSLRERYTSVANYIAPLLAAAGDLRLVSIALFGGRMDLYKLNWLQMLFVLLVVRAEPVDARNWPFIRTWAKQVAPKLLGG